jgi:hypothetical protein
LFELFDHQRKLSRRKVSVRMRSCSELIALARAMGEQNARGRARLVARVLIDDRIDGATHQEARVAGPAPEASKRDAEGVRESSSVARMTGGGAPERIVSFCSCSRSDPAFLP